MTDPSVAPDVADGVETAPLEPDPPATEPDAEPATTDEPASSDDSGTPVVDDTTPGGD